MGHQQPQKMSRQASVPPPAKLPAKSDVANGNGNGSGFGANKTNMGGGHGNGFTNNLKGFPMGDDLIDLGGQFDSKKILEFFDPLLSPEQASENSGSSSASVSQNDKSSVAIPPPKVADRSSLPLLPSEASKSMNSSKSGFPAAGAQRHSLYPDLSEAAAAGTLNPNSFANFQSDSPYSTLQKQLMDFDESNIYDAHNPLDYLYAVSCSSASSTVASEFYYTTMHEGGSKEATGGGGVEEDKRSIGFTHFFRDSVSSTDSIPPELPPRNHEQSRSKLKENEPEVQRRVRNSTVDKVVKTYYRFITT